MTIRFSPQVGSLPFDCNSTYKGIFKSRATVQPLDFRLYVHDVALIGPDGARMPLTLNQDEKWQFQNVALLDFEDKSGSCINGTVDTRVVIEGTAPAGPYAALEFGIGVPYDLNHENRNLMASPPLNLSGLFWVWQDGYKFVRADVRVLPEQAAPYDFIVHLGSSGCSTNPLNGKVTCVRPNRGRALLPFHDASSQVVVADYASLVEESDLTNPDEELGCMSEMNSTGCAPLLTRLGVDPNTGAADSSHQALFRVNR